MTSCVCGIAGPHDAADHAARMFDAYRCTPDWLSKSKEDRAAYDRVCDVVHEHLLARLGRHSQRGFGLTQWGNALHFYVPRSS